MKSLKIYIDIKFVKGSLKDIEIKDYHVYDVPYDSTHTAREVAYWSNIIRGQSTVGAYKASRAVFKVDEKVVFEYVAE